MRKIIGGNVDLSYLHLTELFDLSDVKVMRDFKCNNNYLTGLEGAPHTVVEDFYCDINNLTSLEGASHTVGGHFSCQGNNLTSLEGIPKTVNYSFYIDKVLKDRFPEEYIRSLCKIKGRVVYA